MFSLCSGLQSAVYVFVMFHECDIFASSANPTQILHLPFTLSSSCHICYSLISICARLFLTAPHSAVQNVTLRLGVFGCYRHINRDSSHIKVTTLRAERPWNLDFFLAATERISLSNHLIIPPSTTPMFLTNQYQGAPIPRGKTTICLNAVKRKVVPVLN
jgi:hypothetical protein